MTPFDATVKLQHRRAFPKDFHRKAAPALDFQNVYPTTDVSPMFNSSNRRSSGASAP